MIRALNHLSGKLNFHFPSTSGFLQCLKQPTWSRKTKLVYKFHRVATRITLGKCEDEGQGVNQRVNSASQIVFSVEKWEVVPAELHLSSQVSENNKLHQTEAIFPPAFSNSYFQIISSVPKLAFCEIPGPITEGSWRCSDHSRLLPNWDAPLLSHTSCPTPELPGQVREGLCNRAGSLIHVPTWFSFAKSSTLA